MTDSLAPNNFAEKDGTGNRLPKKKGSTSSSVSFASKLSAKSGFHFSFKPSMRLRNTQCEDLTVDVGDVCETVSIVTVRQEESLDSDVVAELQIGSACEILSVGEPGSRRAQVKTGSVTGWISIKTKAMEPLVVKRKKDISFAIEDFEVGGQHEVKSMVTVRVCETLDSEVLTELKPGALVKILEICPHNRRRAYVHSEHGNGWISLATKSGELLVGKVTESYRQDRGGLFGASSSKIKSLLESARSGDLESIKKMVEGGSGIMSKFATRPSLNSNDIRGKTALIYASAFGNKDIVEYLVSKSEIDVNILDDTQKSALHHASKRTRRRRGELGDTQAEIVNLLLHAGAYIEGRDHNGCTALMFAVANGDDTVTRALLDARANVNVKDFEGHTPLDYTRNFGHDNLTKLLRSFGAMGEESDEENNHHVAATTNRVSAVVEQEESAPLPESTAEPGGVAAKAGKAKVEKKKTAASKKADKEEDGASPKACKTKAKAKGKAKAKTKPAAKRVSMKMAEEMAVEGHDDMDIKVEEVTADTNEMERAQGKLKSVMECTSTSPDELDGAIKVAMAAGVPEAELEKAREKSEKLRAKARAITKLRVAMEERTCAGLREAIETAKEKEIAPAEIAQAQAILAEEEPREKARVQLSAAQDKGDPEAMKAALKAAKDAKLDPAECLPFEQLLKGAESKAEAEAALKKAIAERDVAQLKFAIQQAKEAGVVQASIASAEQVLTEEEPKQRARDLIASALENPNETDLLAATKAGKDAKLDPSELVEVEKALEGEKEKKVAVANLQKVVEQYASVNFQDLDALVAAKQGLTVAINSAKAAKVAESHLADAELRRRRLHNGVEDLKGSIRVFCRIRPLSKKEKDQGDCQITEGTDAMTLKIKADKSELTFQFDAVFTPGTQEEVFEDCRDLVQSAADGYNVTLFAYGQTGAGKTFTMGGVPGNLGVSPRTIREVFLVTERGKARFNYTVMASMLELYRNDVIDLLSKGDKHAAAKKPNIRQDKTGMVIIEHLIEEECKDAEELEKVLEKGNNQRTVAATAMNSESSRSHLVLIIKIVSVNRETKDQLRGKILICDLAGSERLKKSQVMADMQKEAIEINKSLTALGDVIQALTLNHKQIPYRNHKLTQLMQDSLGGSAKTLMFVNCSPASSNLDETVMSLKYAQRAKTITNAAAKVPHKTE